MSENEKQEGMVEGKKSNTKYIVCAVLVGLAVFAVLLF